MIDNLDRLRELIGSNDPEILIPLIEALPDAVLVADAKGLIVLVNKQCEFLFGYHRSALLGQSVDQLLPDAARPKHPDHRAAFFREPRVRPMGAGQPLFGRRQDGTELPIDINLSPLVTPLGVFAAAVIRRRA